MADIILATLNAKYLHSAFGLRYLMANLAELRSRTELLEFDLNQRPIDIAERILARNPLVIGLGVYVWNVAAMEELVGLIKRIAPETIVVLGGPEVSHETDQQEIVRLADYVVAGEGDAAFLELARQVLAGRQPEGKVLHPPPPDLPRLNLPYDEYTSEDIEHRLIYVEASRGCVFRCEFCLSSLDRSVRAFPLEPFLEAMARLLERGVRHFKFVDRTFNLNPRTGLHILEFFLDRLCPGLFLHFEMVPDRLPAELREAVARFPSGTLQFEVGVQTFNPEVAERISRRQDYAALEDNLRFLHEQTNAHVHADLIVGLPGESVESFGCGFDRLVALAPQEIQVGILKRLRGTPITRHDAEWDMVYSSRPPYEILCNRQIDFAMMQRLRRFARYWDLLANSGNFVESTPSVWEEDKASPFEAFLALSDWLYATTGARHAIALVRLTRLLHRYLTAVKGLESSRVAATLLRDYQRGGRSDVPEFLRASDSAPGSRERRRRRARGTQRQERHAAS